MMRIRATAVHFIKGNHGYTGLREMSGETQKVKHIQQFGGGILLQE